MGGGSWGTALAMVLAKRFQVVHWWVRDAARAAEMQAARENAVYLPNTKLPENVLVSADFAAAPWVVNAVPSAYLREVCQTVQPRQAVRAISAVKGIEAKSFLRMSEVIAECWGTKLKGPVAALSGPTFAKEVAAGLPAAVVVACEEESFAQAVQAACAGTGLRVYTNTDIRGVELAGALKNCIAIAAGAVEGLGAGSNSVAALITRGLAEIGRLIEACGGRASTVAGLAGLGDLVLTCTGQLSRNRRAGMELAKGRAIADILRDSSMVAEGVVTTPVALALAAQKGVEMPITNAVAKMLSGIDARAALQELVERTPKREGI
jgi:glycerol-3-phosphate dehydrogenase (NAD(P)+)